MLDMAYKYGMTDDKKPVEWVGSSLDDLKKLPEDVQSEVGYALYLAQTGDSHPSVKPFKGVVKGASVLEIIEDYDSDTYRAVYTINFPSVVYVLHVFQKKSKKGISTPKQEVKLIENRFKAAKEHYEMHHKSVASKRKGSK